MSGVILKISERIIEKLIRQELDLDEMQIGFMSGFILRQRTNV